MKKGINSLIIILLVTAIFLSGCGAKPEASVEELFSSMKSFNVEKIQKLMDPDLENEDSRDTLEELTDEEEENMEELLEYFKDKASKIEYEVGESQVDGDKAVVDVHVRYVDGSELIANVFTNFMGEAIVMAFSGSDMSDERSEELFNSILEKELEKEDERFVEKDLKIDLVEKDGNWYIGDLSDEMLDVMFTNFVSVFKAMDEEFEDDLGDELEDEEVVEIGMNDKFELENIELKVNSIESTDLIVNEVFDEEIEAKDGRKFVILDVDIKNITK